MSQRTFNAFLDTQHDLNKSTITGYKTSIAKFEDLAKQPFEVCYLDHDLIHKVLNELDDILEDSTWNTWLERYRRLAKWLYDEEDENCPKVWRNIKKKKIDWDKKLKEKCFSEDEFYNILDVIDSLRDKAFVAVGGEAGLRPGELLAMDIKDCKPESYGFKITVSGKTGTRSIPIVMFAAILRLWLNHHPLKHNPDAPLWIMRRNGKFLRVSYFTMNSWHFKRYCSSAKVYRWKTVLDKKTGETKQFNTVSLHYLRHTKATWTAKNRKVHVGIKQANDMFGWSPNSTRYLHYSHIAGQDSEDTFLELAGVKEVNEPIKPSVLLRKKCFSCGEQNSAEALYCFKCGYVLDEEQAKHLVAREQMIDKILKAAEKADEDKT